MADEDESACNLSGRKRKRGVAAIEPPEYVRDTKTCPNPECGSTALCVFKYLNNGKPHQPRYRCLRCNHMHTHYPPGKERPRPHGKTYTKHTLANPPEHHDLFDLRCPNPACGALENQARFLYYNNKKPLQPRYRCLVCSVPWQPKLKAKPPAQPGSEGVPPQAGYDHNVDSCYTTERLAAPLDHMQEFMPPQQTLCYNPEVLDSANLRPDDPNYLNQGMMQYSQVQQPYDYPADHDVNSMPGSCTELYPDGDPNYMAVMQGLQLQQPYDYPTEPVNSMGSWTEYMANVNYTMEGQQPFSESQSYQYVDPGGADANVNYMMEGDQQPCSELSQDQYYVNSLGCTHHDPSISYITMLQAGDPSGHISMQAGGIEQLYHSELGCCASSETSHVDANAIEAGEEQYVVYPGLDPALSCGVYALDAPEDTDQWISELLAVDAQ